ncbi:hypothetical protein [Pectobacterium carotovorum]|uniref:hypothetical protein n=1 Tax=Pectobacterium carotovorum TaxID=554 RepID=UPI001E56A3B2|nr:hypothetical protein [Pectobacterium carotovorum]UFT95025.1 hypothetical protein LQF52_03035 [Pectobacterium carotovorum]
MNTLIKSLLVLSAISCNPFATASTVNVDSMPQVIILKVMGCELNKRASYKEYNGKISYYKIIDKEHAAKICDGFSTSLTSFKLSVNNGGSGPSVVGVWQSHDYVKSASFRKVNSERGESEKSHNEYKTGFSLGIYASEKNDAIFIDYELAELYDADRWKDSLGVDFFVLHSFANKNRAKFNRDECLLFWGGVNPSSEARRFFSICES